MGARIFVVEDERIVAEDVRVTLEAGGYQLAGIAASRDEALEAVARCRPDLVLMDIVLKGQGDGVEAARIIRETMDIPVVFLTAHADQATLRRAKLTEPFGYIVKPFEDRDLFSGIEMGLYRHRAEKRVEERERWLAAILASLGQGVIAADAMGAVRLLNAAAEKITGWRLGDASGRDLSEVYRPCDAESGEALEIPSLRALLEGVGEHAKPVRGCIVRRDGTRLEVEQFVSPIMDGDETLNGTVVVLRQQAQGGEAQR